MRSSPVLLTLFLASLPLQAQEPTPAQKQAELEQRMCAETECQRGLRIILKQKDGKTYDQTFAVFPAIVQGIGVTVAAGQTIHVEAGIDGDRLVDYRAVERVTNPKATITATFEQMEDGGMMLSLHNPFDKALKFNMGIMPLDAEDLYKTSSCPVVAGGSSYELWPYPIFQLVLGNGRLLEPGNTVACVE